MGASLNGQPPLATAVESTCRALVEGEVYRALIRAAAAVIASRLNSPHEDQARLGARDRRARVSLMSGDRTADR